MKNLETYRFPSPSAEGVTSICFRVTRACNLSCPYCQAPPNTKQLSLSQLFAALKFFCGHGTERVKFTGGEPFIHHGILNLIAYCRDLGMEPTIVTNGTVLPAGAEECLKRNRARVKVSLHGPRETHNRIQNVPAYYDTLSTVRKLIARGIETSVHTLIHRGSDLDLKAWVEFLAKEQVHKVSFMPFVPRGRGTEFKNKWGFNNDELRYLSDQVHALANTYQDTIIVRYLDFAGKPYLVFETDGTLQWQLSEESGDIPLFRVPTGNISDHTPAELVKIAV